MSAYVSKYSWRSGYSYKTSAEVVGNALSEIEKRDGEVTSKAFLEYSRPEDSETHSMFEWDDTVAAEKYRLAQSGRIINQLQVEMVYTEDATPKKMDVSMDRTDSVQRISAFVNVTPRATKSSAVFNNIVTAMTNDDKRKQVLANALSYLKSFEEKYQSYEELAGVIDAIRKFEVTIVDEP